MTITGFETPIAPIETLLDLVTDAVLVVDQQGCVLYANATAHALLGREILLGTNCGLPVADNAVVQLVRQNGMIWVQLRALPIDWCGDRAAHVLTLTDVSERKQVEESRRITAGVFDNSQEAILITDRSNVIVDVNPAFTRITGYSRDEVVGHKPSLLSSGRQDKAFYSAMWKTLNHSGKWRGEIWNRRKSGEVYAELLSISAICDENAIVQRYVATFSDISHLKEYEAKLRHVAHYDALTGIPNRALLVDRLKQAVAQAARKHHKLAVCYLDLDGFKAINDGMGHETGDQVLIEIALRIERNLRGGDTVARLGGDEFVVLLRLEQEHECLASIDRLLALIAKPVLVNGERLAIGASIGVSIYPRDDCDADTLLRHADQAMYIAKQSGKNCFYIYDPEADLRIRNHNELLREIQNGLERDQFEIHYQPKVNLRSGQLVGAEALIRWRHPQRGLLLPSQFLKPIENTELDIRLGNWVIVTALAQLERWHKIGLDIDLSINISAYHLESSGFAHHLRQQIALLSIPRDKVQIEVLETAALTDIAKVKHIIAQCRQFGIGFALDDFGTGYSSLSYLSRLPVDELKIDQTFVHGMMKKQADRTIVQGIIALAKAFDRRVIAEGVETDEQSSALLKMGCEIGQGYGIAMPMSADDLQNRYRR